MSYREHLAASFFPVNNCSERLEIDDTGEEFSPLKLLEKKRQIFADALAGLAVQAGQGIVNPSAGDIADLIFLLSESCVLEVDITAKAHTAQVQDLFSGHSDWDRFFDYPDRECDFQIKNPESPAVYLAKPIAAKTECGGFYYGVAEARIPVLNNSKRVHPGLRSTLRFMFFLADGRPEEPLVSMFRKMYKGAAVTYIPKQSIR